MTRQQVETKLHVRRPAVAADGRLPRRHMAGPGSSSPPVCWEGAPDGTQEYVLLMTNCEPGPAARVHWLVYKIPVGLHGALPQGDVWPALEGRNSWGLIGYRGPDPDWTGPVCFTLYALGSHMDLRPGQSRGPLFESIEGWLIDQAEFTCQV